MNTLQNIMETQGVVGYTGQVKLITEELLQQVDPAMKSSFDMVFDMLDLFQAENVHRLRPGTAIKSEKYMLKYFKRGAEDFIKQLEKYEQSYESRMLFHPLPPISLDRTPEDLFPKIMSYLSPIVRLENLRRKYTNEFLLDGLRKKKIGQLKYIHQEYEDTIYDSPNQTPELCGLCGWIDVICDSIAHITDYVEEYKYKHIRVEGILNMYLAVEDHLMNTLIKSSVYDTYCNFAIKMLHILVIVCRQKTPKKITGCHDARVMTKVPYAV